MKGEKKYKISASRIKESRESTLSTLPPEISVNGKPKKRKKKTLTQNELAQLVRCDPNYISMLESGDYPLSFEMAHKIGEVCNVSPEYLLGKTDNKHYAGDVSLAISKMQRYSAMQDDFVEYVCLISGIEKSTLSEREKQDLIKEAEWYAEVRLQKMVTEGREEKDGKETK